MDQRLLSLLHSDDSDYWYDAGSIEARQIFEQLSKAEIKKISSSWQSLSTNAQEHLAYILGAGTSTIERELIIDMTKAVDNKVAYRAREALVEFDG